MLDPEKCLTHLSLPLTDMPPLKKKHVSIKLSFDLILVLVLRHLELPCCFRFVSLAGSANTAPSYLPKVRNDSVGKH